MIKATYCTALATLVTTIARTMSSCRYPEVAVSEVAQAIKEAIRSGTGNEEERKGERRVEPALTTPPGVHVSPLSELYALTTS